MGNSKHHTVGYWYKAGLHFGFCLGPIDKITALKAGDREIKGIPGGNGTPYVGWTISESGSIFLADDQLFGGEKKEGGIYGTADFEFGESTQAKNSYLTSVLGSTIPAFRGIFSIIFNKGFVGANNYYIKPWSGRVTRIHKEVITGNLQWYNSKAEIPNFSADNINHALVYNSDAGTTTFRIPGYVTQLDDTACIEVATYTDFRGGKMIFDQFSKRIISTLKASGYILYYSEDAGRTWAELTSDYVNGDFSDNPTSHTTGVIASNPYYPLIVLNSYKGPYTSNDNGDSWTSRNWAGNGDFARGGGSDKALFGDFMFWNDALKRFDAIPCFKDSANASSSGYGMAHGTQDGITWSGTVGQNLGSAGYACVGAAQIPLDNGGIRYLITFYTDFTAYYTDDYSATMTAISDISGDCGGYIAYSEEEDIVLAVKDSGGLYRSTDKGLTFTPITCSGLADPQYFKYSKLLQKWVASSLGSAAKLWYSEDSGSSWTLFSGVTAQASQFEFVDTFYAGMVLDMNPAHIIRECLTERETGLGHPTANINDTNFKSAADVYHGESCGLSFKWTGEQNVKDFIDYVLMHCLTILRLSPFDGQWSLKPLRNDYTPAALTVYDEDDILEIRNFRRAAYADTVNEITVIYREALTGDETPVTVHNLANIQAQGRIVNETIKLLGIKKYDLAARVALSLLKIKSTPLAGFQAVCNRNVWQVLPGDVIKVSWTKLGLSELIVRVLEVNYGSITDGQIILNVAEDVFGLESSSYTDQQATQWTEPDTSPADFVYQQAIETPYWHLSQALTPGDLASLDQDSGYLMVVAAPPNGFTYGFEIWSKVGAADYSNQSEDGTACPSCTLDAELDRANSSNITFSNALDMDLVAVNDLCILGSGVLAEWGMVTAIDSDAGTATIERGVIDTTPQIHSAGTRLFFPGVAFGNETVERVATQQIDVKLNPLSTRGSLGIDTATAFSVTMDSRHFRPYPPGDIKIGGTSYPTIGYDSEPQISWAHRDRTLQTASIILQTDSDVGPETGVTVKLNFYDVQNSPRVLLDSTTGQTGKTFTPTFTPGTYLVEMEVISARNDSNSPVTEYENWQNQVRQFYYTETGRTLEDGTPRVTETDVLREQE